MNGNGGGVASAFMALEIAHTHYWTKLVGASEVTEFGSAVFSGVRIKDRLITNLLVSFIISSSPRPRPPTAAERT